MHLTIILYWYSIILLAIANKQEMLENMCKHFDKLLAEYCAPTLLCEKPACLVTCLKQRFPNGKDLVSEYNKAFHEKGWALEILKETDTAYLVLVYHIDLLTKCISCKRQQEMLVQEGYADFSCDECLHCLKQRLNRFDTFPHEIGVFLGYPVDDILAFKKHNGKNFTCSGYWKVYHNEEQAKQTFETYNHCRAVLTDKLAQGEPLLEVLS